MRFVSALLAMALAAGGVALASGSASAADAQATRLSLVIPLTVPPETTGLIPAEILETYTSPTGILTRRLNAVAGQPVAIGIDPMIIASIRILGNTAPQSALDWLQLLQDADNETFALSYADSDLAALSQAGSTTVLGPTSFQIDASLFPVVPEEQQTDDGQTDGGQPEPPPTQTSPPVEPEVPTSETLTDWPHTIEDLLWPRQNTVTAADLTTFNTDAPVTTLLSSGNVTAASGASGSVDGHAVLVSDETISSLVNQAVHAVSITDWQAAIDELEAALGNWSGSGPVLATFDRAIPDTFNRLSETVAALTTLTEVELADFSTTLAEPPASLRLVDSPVETDRISRLRLLLAAEARIVPFASVMTDPAPLTGERRLSLLALSSNSWVDPTTTWTTSVDEWLERSNAILTSVQIAESSTLNFFQDKGNLPIAVSNNLNFPVTVYVTVRSATGILVVLDNRVPIEIEANSQSRASIPVQSIANGEASLLVSLSSDSRVAIGAPKTVTTNVVAGWETTATFVIAALLLLIFVAGIVRTVLKRRRMLAAENEGITSEGKHDE